MDDFNPNINNDELSNEVTEPEIIEELESSDDFVTDDESMWNRVEYTPDEKIKDYKPMSKGFKIFCLVMSAVVVLTATAAGGYFLGRSNVSTNNSYIGNNVTVGLEAKPVDTDASTPAQVYQMVNESIVGIRTYNEAGKAGDSSGVIYSADGYIVTNDHIYAEIGAPKFKVFTYDGTEYDAVYVAGDTVSDLAVLKIVNGTGFKPATFGDSAQLINGENVVAVGRPNDATDSSSITSGVISLTSRRVKTTSSYTASLIQTDSAINPGSSGGALVNMYGQVVGITASKLAGVEYDAIGFAIPTKTMKRVVEQLIAQGKVTDRAKLGVTYTEINSVTAAIKNYEAVGLLVASVSDDSDAYGKIDEGDMITHVNGIKITNDDIILNTIEDCKAGDTITLTVLLISGDEITLDVKLRANIGESSYSAEIGNRNETQIPQGGDKDGQGGGKFDFPYGE